MNSDNKRYLEMQEVRRAVIVDLENRKSRIFQFSMNYPEVYKVLTKLKDHGHIRLFEKNVLFLRSNLSFKEELGRDKKIINKIRKCVDFLIKNEEVKNDKDISLVIEINILNGKALIVNSEEIGYRQPIYFL